MAAPARRSCAERRRGGEVGTLRAQALNSWEITRFSLKGSFKGDIYIYIERDHIGLLQVGLLLKNLIQKIAQELW